MWELPIGKDMVLVSCLNIANEQTNQKANRLSKSIASAESVPSGRYLTVL